jgi:hypothetical protein
MFLGRDFWNMRRLVFCDHRGRSFHYFCDTLIFTKDFTLIILRKFCCRLAFLDLSLSLLRASLGWADAAIGVFLDFIFDEVRTAALVEHGDAFLLSLMVVKELVRDKMGRLRLFLLLLSLLLCHLLVEDNWLAVSPGCIIVLRH